MAKKPTYEELEQKVKELENEAFELKGAEEKFIKSEKLYKEAQSLARIGHWDYEPHEDSLTWSDELYSIFEIDKDVGPVSIEAFLERIHPEDRDTRRGQAEKGENYRSEYRIVMDNGAVKHIREEVVIVRQENGKILIMKGIAQDITRQKQNEEALRESENRFRAQYQGSPTATFTWQWNGEDFVLADYNKATAEITRGRAHEYLGKTALEMYQNRPEIQVDLQRCLAEKPVIRKNLVSQDFLPGRYVMTNYAFVPPDLVMVHVTDMTELKQAEEALLNQTYFLQKAQEIGQIGTWELDIKKNELLWTDENYKIFGLPIGTKLTYEIFLNCVHPDDREYVDKEWKAAFDKKPYDIEHRLLMDGKVKWVREKAELHFNERDECIRGTGFSQDITDAKKAAEALRESEERYRTVADFTYNWENWIALLDIRIPALQVENPAPNVRYWQSGMTRSLEFSRIRAPWSHI